MYNIFQPLSRVARIYQNELIEEVLGASFYTVILVKLCPPPEAAPLLLVHSGYPKY